MPFKVELTPLGLAEKTTYKYYNNITNVTNQLFKYLLDNIIDMDFLFLYTGFLVLSLSYGCTSHDVSVLCSSACLNLFSRFSFRLRFILNISCFPVGLYVHHCCA